MRRFKAMLHRWTGLFRRGTREAELSAELQSHLDLLAERNVAAGMSPEDAKYAAHRAFGGVAQVAERSRDEWHLVWLEQFAQDLRGAFRLLRKNSAFAAITIAIIALGIGATTSIFSIVNSVMLRPLPYPDSGRLVILQEMYANVGNTSVRNVTPGVFLAWKKQATSFSALASDWYLPANVTVGDSVTRRGGRFVSPNYFSTYGVSPILGRDFLPEEFQAGKADVVILNYKLWVELFNSDPAIIGQRLRVNSHTCEIVGVLPKLFMPDPTTEPGLFMPQVVSAQYEGDFTSPFIITALGRLRPGATLEAATAELNLIAARLAPQLPGDRKGWGVKITPLLETKIGSIRPFLYLLSAAVGLLLIIACVNVANLLLARASSRAKELAVRIALGASRGRVIRQLLVESVVLSVIGGLLGCVLAYVSLDALVAMVKLTLPRTKEIAVDGQVLGFAFLLSLLSGVGFGVLPALRATRVDLSQAMKAGGRGASGDAQGNRLRSFLVVFEIALALVLLSGAGLLMNSFIRLQQVPVGFDMGKTRVVKFRVRSPSYQTPESLRRVIHEVRDRLGGVPGVHSVAFSTAGPGWGRDEAPVEIGGRAAGDLARADRVGFYLVTPDYFRLMGIALRAGRWFDAHDNETSAKVAVVSEDFVAKNFTNGDAIGQRVRVNTGWGSWTASPGQATLVPEDYWAEIIGVVSHVREAGPANATPYQIYEPLDQRTVPYLNLFIRSQGVVPGLDHALRKEMNQIDPELPLPDPGPYLMDFYNNLIAPQRFSLLLFGVFSLAALVLSAMGTYGVVSYSVAQRTREIGIRVAIGAQASDIRRLVFARAGLLIGIGLLLGAAAALASTQLLQSLLYEISTRDPWTLLAVILVLAGTALLACWIPARRATKVDPMVALRAE